MPAIPVVIKEERVVIKEQKLKRRPSNKSKQEIPDVPSTCTMCGKKYPFQPGNFPRVNSRAYKMNNGFATICLDCVEQFFQDHVQKYNNDKKKAIRRTCELLDCYFAPDSWEKLGEDATSLDYLNRLQLLRSPNRQSWDDTLDEEEVEMAKASASKRDTAAPTVVTGVSDLGLTPEEMLEAVDIFGEGFEPKAYEYMMRIYRGYITPLGDTVTAGQLKSARFLAALEYRCMEAIKNDKPNASALSSTLRKSIAESGFDTVVKKEEDGMVPLGVLIKQIETYTPAQYLKNTPYTDVDKQGTYYHRFVERPTMNLLSRASQKVTDELSITDEEAAAFDSLGSDDDG